MLETSARQGPAPIFAAAPIRRDGLPAPQEQGKRSDDIQGKIGTCGRDVSGWNGACRQCAAVPVPAVSFQSTRAAASVPIVLQPGSGIAAILELRSVYQRLWSVSAAHAYRFRQLPRADAAELRPAGLSAALRGRQSSALSQRATCSARDLTGRGLHPETDGRLLVRPQSRRRFLFLGPRGRFGWAGAAEGTARADRGLKQNPRGRLDQIKIQTRRGSGALSMSTGRSGFW